MVAILFSGQFIRPACGVSLQSLSQSNVLLPEHFLDVLVTIVRAKSQRGVMKLRLLWSLI